MSIRSIFLGLVVEEDEVSQKALDYAVDLAARRGASLSVGLGVPRFVAAGSLAVPGVAGMLQAANHERHQRAEHLATGLTRAASLAGVPVRIEIVQNDYLTARDRLVQLSRASDLVVVTRSPEISPSEQDMAEDLLFTSGRPVIIVPPEWDGPATFKTVVVGWDGSAKAARAVGDAMGFLAEAASVDVVCVKDDPNRTKVLAGVEIAEHLARHCRAVKTTELAPVGGDIAAAMLAHATREGAGLLVMGGYGNARWKQMLLGGVTHDVITRATLPVLLSS